MCKGQRVTIITVCYNSAQTIERTLESVLQQTYSNIEYIVVDGNSTDNTMDIIREFLPRFDGRLRLISEPDEGIYDAMNKGIRLANGDIIGILNSDDYYEEDAVENIVKSWNGEPMQVLYGLLRKYRNGYEDTVSLLSHEYLYERMIWHPSCFVTKDVYDVIGVFDTTYKSVADYDFMLRAYESGKVTFRPIYHVIANFSEGGMSESLDGYLEGIKYLRDKGKISQLTYRMVCIYEPIKRWVIKTFWR